MTIMAMIRIRMKILMRILTTVTTFTRNVGSLKTIG